jgi:creatinine amidohydrolase/Fe(II)-dependent formamide hydrolase-like protein
MMLALTPELIDRNELSQMHGPYITGLSAIAGVNPGIYRWRQLSSRSPIGVIGEAGAATPEKGVRLLDAISDAVARALLEERVWTEPM